MRKHLLKILFAATIVFVVTSCKNNEEAENKSMVLDEVNDKVEARDFVIDTENSSIHWEGYKPTQTHTGTISIKEGKISLKDEKIVEGDFVIDMKSIEVTDMEGEDKERLKAHLMGILEGTKDHFFDVEQFPTAAFKVTGTSTEDGKSFLIGELTIKNKTEQVSFPIETNMVDNDVAEIRSAPFKIDRSKWNIKFKSKSFFDSLGDNFISDEIQLEIRLVAKGL